LLNEWLRRSKLSRAGTGDGMTVRILVLIVIAVIAAKLTFSGQLPSTAVAEKIGIQAIRSVFSAM
jgi:uncharacterized membrane protein YtjA (UPF0391 family)